MIEIMISRKNRLEPTLILQSVNDMTNCKRYKTEKHFFSVFIKYTQLTLIQPRLNPGIKKNSRYQGSSFATILGSGIKILNVRSVGKKYTLLRPCSPSELIGGAPKILR